MILLLQFVCFLFASLFSWCGVECFQVIAVLSWASACVCGERAICTLWCSLVLGSAVRWNVCAHVRNPEPETRNRTVLPCSPQ